MTDRTKTICPPIFDLGGIKKPVLFPCKKPFLIPPIPTSFKRILNILPSFVKPLQYINPLSSPSQFTQNTRLVGTYNSSSSLYCCSKPALISPWYTSLMFFQSSVVNSSPRKGSDFCG